ncbi:helix-turn-helix transcriptional regulator [Cytobacillus praedii]|uniref:helix-turn-helix domain-containing protein n=1 Tax=Cytobacillus praedii TaxID=1742358 RepID=UPI002E22B0C8|nr:helix-turn-helix transcriptional regulator [Cytobacillus praedii]
MRKAGQWNLESFGELALGASKGTVSNWENGVNIPNKRRLERIAKIGNKTVKWILNGGLDVDVL